MKNCISMEFLYVSENMKAKRYGFMNHTFLYSGKSLFSGNFPMDIVDVSLLQKKVYGKIITEKFFLFYTVYRYTGTGRQKSKESGFGSV